MECRERSLLRQPAERKGLSGPLFTYPLFERRPICFFASVRDISYPHIQYMTAEQ